MVCCTVFIQSYKPWWSIYSFAVFVSLSAKPCTHAFIHPSRKSSSLSFGVVVGDRMFLWSYNLKVAKIWLFFFLHSSPAKQHRLYSLQLLSHMCPSSSLFLFSSYRLPASRDLKITARRMTPLSSLSFSPSFVGGDLKFCFKTATLPILLKPPPSFCF